MPSWLTSIWDALVVLSRAHVAGFTFFGFVVFALDVWAIERAIRRGHGVHGTLAWIFAILALPMVGVLAFFALASPSVKRITLRKRRASAQVRQALGESASSGKTAAGDAMLDVAAALTGLPPTAGNAVELLTDDALTFERIEAAIRAARRFVWAEYYIIRNDETGRRFLDLLAERARAGVEVRLVYDAVGSMRINAQRLAAVVAAGGQARAFEPMNPLRRRLSYHLRNHRKLIVVDGDIGFTGGMNIGDEYSGRRRREGMQTFRDSHLELRGPAVRSLAQAFAEDWAFAGGGALQLPEPATVAEPAVAPVAALHSPAVAAAGAAAPHGSLVAIVPSGPDQEHNASLFVHFAAIASARKRVFLTSPYFIPDESMVSALVSAALRRVDVRVLLPTLAASDVPLAAHAARWYYGKLLRGGVRIYEYGPSMLHAKTLVADGQIACVGSANIDLRSYRLNFEIGALVNDERFAVLLEHRFVRDLASSTEVTLELLARQGKLLKLRCVLSRLVSPML